MRIQGWKPLVWQYPLSVLDLNGISDHLSCNFWRAGGPLIVRGRTAAEDVQHGLVSEGPVNSGQAPGAKLLAGMPLLHGLALQGGAQVVQSGKFY